LQTVVSIEDDNASFIKANLTIEPVGELVSFSFFVIEEKSMGSRQIAQFCFSDGVESDMPPFNSAMSKHGLIFVFVFVSVSESLSSFAI
jgi:hypothetical protein